MIDTAKTLGGVTANTWQFLCSSSATVLVTSDDLEILYQIRGVAQNDLLEENRSSES